MTGRDVAMKIRCRKCGADPGKDCLTNKGRVTDLHRIRVAEGWSRIPDAPEGQP